MAVDFDIDPPDDTPLDDGLILPPQPMGRIRPIGAAEFLAAEYPDPSYVWKGLLPYRGLGLLVAAPKAGKSHFCRHLALSVARGAAFGNREVERSPVLLVSAQDRPAAVQGHLRLLRLHPDDPFYTYAGPLNDTLVLNLNELTAIRDDLDPGLIIIDMLIDLARITDMNAYGEIDAALRTVREWARAGRSAVLVTHHAKKTATREQADPISAALGSVAIAGAVDALLYLRKTTSIENEVDGEVDFQAQVREGQDITTPLVFTWRAKDRGFSYRGTSAETAYTDISAEILRLLQGYSGSHPQKDLIAQIDRPEESVRQVIKKMMEKDQIEVKNERGRAVVYINTRQMPVVNETISDFEIPDD